jgi:hypothetical protein
MVGSSECSFCFSLLKVESLSWRPKNESSVADPDPYVFEPLRSVSTGYGSGSVSGSGSGSFYHQAKVVRKTLIPVL